MWLRQARWILAVIVVLGPSQVLSQGLDGAAAAPRAAEPAASSLYQVLVRDAVAEYERGSWAISRELFQRAHTLRPSARTLRGMGMADFNMRAYARAVSELELALSSAEQPLDELMRAQVEELLAQASRYVGRYAVEVVPRDAVLLVNGQPPLRNGSGEVLLDFGSYSLEAHKDGYQPAVVTLEVREPERRVLALHALPTVRSAPEPPQPREAPTGTRFPWTWASGATSAGALAGAGITALFADKRFAELERDCSAQGGCFGDVAGSEHVRRLDRTGIALLTTGGVLLAATVVAALIERKRGRSSQAEVQR